MYMTQRITDSPREDSNSVSPNPWLIVTDLDGTLLDSVGELSMYAETVLRRLSANGNVVALASGRHWDEIVPIRNQIRANCPIISCNGALVGLREPGDLFTATLDAKVLRLLISLIQNLPIDVMASTSNGLFRYRHHHDIMSEVVENGVGNVISELEHLHGCDVYKLSLVVGGDTEPMWLTGYLNKNMKGAVEVTVANDITVDVNAENVCKATALPFLRKLYGILPGHVMAFGNQGNDEKMLCEADLSLAVGDATEAIRKIADQVIECSFRDGVARWLDKFFNLS